MEVDRIAAAIERLRGERGRLDAREAQRVAVLLARQDESTRREQQELAKIDRGLHGFAARRQALQSAESSELAAALQKLQARFVAQQLARRSVVGVAIPGLGPRTKLRLVVAGVRTAASIGGVQVVPATGRKGSEAVLIEAPGRGQVHIEGLEPKQARALLSWRKEIEADARRNTPPALPPAHEAALRAKHAARRQALDRREAKARQRATQQQDAVRQRHARERDTLTQQLADLRANFAAARHDGDRAAAEAQKHLAEREWAFALARHELAAYQRVSFDSYLRRVLLFQE